MINLELIKKIYSLHSSFKMPAYDKDCHSMREFCQNEDTASLVLEKNNAEEDLIDRINIYI